MTYKTTRFGELEVEQQDIVTMPDGLYGFPSLTNFVILQHKENSPYRWLQSLDDSNIAFLIISPWEFKSDYSPTIPDEDAYKIGATDTETVIVYSIVTIPPGNPQGMTANLAGPIVINPNNQVAKQVIVEGDEYHTRHFIIQEMQSQTVKAAAG